MSGLALLRDEKFGELEVLHQNSDDEERFKALEGEIIDLDSRIERENKLSVLRKSNPPQTDRLPPELNGVSSRETTQGAVPFSLRMRHFLSRGDLQYFSEDEKRELRTFRLEDLPQAGYLVPDEQFVNEIIKGIDDLLFVRQRATVWTLTNAHSLGIPAVTANAAPATWAGEISEATEETTLSYGKRVFRPKYLNKQIPIAKPLLRTAVGLEAEIRRQFSVAFANAEEEAFMTGDQPNQPLGMFTASPDGIDTDRDSSTGNTATEITFDGLIEAQYEKLKPQYWANAAWIMHPTVAKQIRLIRDDSGGAGTGDYLWSESTRAGQPSTLLGFPVFLSQFAPSTPGANNYAAILGDLSWYHIADSLGFTMQTLIEKGALENTVYLIGNMETDGMPVLSEAFVRVQYGT